jgi:3-oxoacyl-[acyl-carrier-protein] synthase-1
MTAKSARLALTGHHVISPVGLDAESTCAALRAGISRRAASDLYLPLPAGPEVDGDDPLVLAQAPDLSTDIDGANRLLVLGLGALRGLAARIGLTRTELPRTGLFVALASPDAATSGWQLGRVYLPELLARSGLDGFAPAHLVVEESGHAGVLSLLARAAALLQTGAVEQVIVLGVDSYVDVARLSALDAAYRLKSQRGVDGFVPGEAAVALLVERADVARKPGRPALAQLGSPRQAVEPKPQSGDRASTGVGLTTALREALRDLPAPGPVSWLLCDLNGESYRAFEWGLVQVRLRAQLAGLLRVHHPADCIGDVGAASGALLVACAAQAFARKCAGDDVAAVWTASDAGGRSAMLVFPPGGVG